MIPFATISKNFLSLKNIQKSIILDFGQGSGPAYPNNVYKVWFNDKLELFFRGLYLKNYCHRQRRSCSKWQKLVYLRHISSRELFQNLLVLDVG